MVVPFSCLKLSIVDVPIVYSWHARYKDIGELMKRCETLVVTRDESMAALQRHQDEIQDQEVQLAAFKEDKHERILNLR